MIDEGTPGSMCLSVGIESFEHLIREAICCSEARSPER